QRAHGAALQPPVLHSGAQLRGLPRRRWTRASRLVWRLHAKGRLLSRLSTPCRGAAARRGLLLPLRQRGRLGARGARRRGYRAGEWYQRAAALPGADSEVRAAAEFYARGRRGPPATRRLPGLPPRPGVIAAPRPAPSGSTPTAPASPSPAPARPESAAAPPGH